MSLARRLPLLAALLAFASAQAHENQLLIAPVKGYTLDAAGKLQRFDALLVEDGKVVATGDAARAQAHADAQRIDGGGHVMLPGLIDAHGHVMGLGQMASQADLTTAKSLGEALAIAKEHAESSSAGWVRGRGWNQVVWKLGRFPTAKELDTAVADRPAWLERVDGHAGWANTLALQRAGITRDTKDPVGGRIERDANGNPTGVLVDAAMALVEKSIPAMDDDERIDTLDAALESMAGVGLTGVHDAGIDEDTYRLYRRYAQQGRLTTRIYAMIGGTDKDFDAIVADGPPEGGGHADEMLSVRSVKLYSDGALGSRGAALLAPYSDDPKNSGLLFSTQAQMVAMIEKAFAKGYQVNVHAIGDRGNRVVLDSFAEAFKKFPEAKARRNRIEHAQVVAVEDIPRFVELGLIASMQPTHATSDMNMAEDRVGAERLRGAYAWRSFLKQGTVVAGGSDFPVESANPFFGLYSAVTRQDHEGEPPGGWHREQAMTREEALRAFTLDAAYAAGQEKELGTLEPGKQADFILIDRDYFAVDPSQIWSTQVLETWVGGRRVYAREETGAE